jgi:hypothetical protein
MNDIYKWTCTLFYYYLLLNKWHVDSHQMGYYFYWICHAKQVVVIVLRSTYDTILVIAMYGYSIKLRVTLLSPRLLCNITPAKPRQTKTLIIQQTTCSRFIIMRHVVKVPCAVLNCVVSCRVISLTLTLHIDYWQRGQPMY